MGTSQPRWFENLPGANERALRLYCFPYAGGSAQVFRNWQRYFLPEISLVLAHLPGRGMRAGEPLFRNLKPLVHALADAFVARDPSPFAFWGHSMGGLIGFELARELRRRGRPGPLALFVSGRSAPHVPDPDPPTFNLPDDEFIAELRRLKGTPEEVLSSPELKAFFLPVIRADFELVETYTYQEEAPLDCPIQVYGGLQDTSVPAERLKAWQKQTVHPSKVRMFRGDHFFIHSVAMDVVQTLRRDALNLLSHAAC
ncbi:MAG TPA: alpha/beta fold hydrolase [Candidatus Sulfotelmatobacter sp.]|nr:alpha/beta fold hydrolase [Candidatus Sulfotelmatobacter sp.]